VTNAVTTMQNQPIQGGPKKLVTTELSLDRIQTPSVILKIKFECKKHRNVIS